MATNGIDFVIGGKDQAKPAMSSVEQSLQRLESKTHSLKSATHGLMAAMGPLIAVFAVVKGAMAAVGGVVSGMDDFDAAQESVRALNQAMELNGGSSEALMMSYEGLSDALERTTNVAAEETQALMKQAAIMGVGNEEIDDMAVAAIGLSEALGVSLDTGLEKVRLATEGNFKAFEKLIPSMKTMATDEEKLAAVLELSARGMAMKEEASKSAAGSAEQMEHRVGNLMETIGSMLSPVRQLVNHGITVLADALSGILAPAAEYVQSVFADMGGWMDWVKEKVIQGVNAIIGAFTFMEVTLKNLDSIWIWIESYVELTMRQIGETIMYTLTEVIPGYVIWFGENIINLFRDAFNGVLQVYYNATRMMGEIIAEMFKFVFQDMGQGTQALGERIGNILASGLTTGFESALTDLPDIAARKISEREQQLANTMSAIGDKLGGEFSDKMKARMVGMGAGAADEINKAIDLKMNAMGGDDAKASKRKDGTFGASINAMESRLLTRGPGSTFEQQMLGRLDRIADFAAEDGDRMQMSVEELKNIGKKLDNNVVMVPAI